MSSTTPEKSGFDIAKEAFEEAVNQLVIKFENLGDEVDEHVWEAAFVEMGYVPDHGPDVHGIASALLNICSSKFGVSHHQFAYWARKYRFIESRYKDVDNMLKDVMHAYDIAYMVTWKPDWLVQNEHSHSLHHDLYEGTGNVRGPETEATIH